MALKSPLVITAGIKEQLQSGDYISALSATGLSNLMGGRLTTESGVPVSTSNRSAQSTLYYTPYLGSVVSLYESSLWVPYNFAQVSLTLTGLTTDTNYDIFLYNNAGTMTLDPVIWSTNQARVTGLATQDGIPVKSGATNRRYVGTIRTTGTTTTEDSDTKRFIWNMYNRRLRRLYVLNNITYTYGTATIRQMNATTTNQVEFVNGIREDSIALSLFTQMEVETGDEGRVGIGTNSTTSFDAELTFATVREFSLVSGADLDRIRLSFTGGGVIVATLGYSRYCLNEIADAGTLQFIGQNRITALWNS